MKINFPFRVLLGVAATVMLGSASPASARNPIVFVHGYSGSPSNFGKMINRFKADGWADSELWAISYNSCNTISTAVSELNKYISDVLRKTGATKVDIIAHSYGGLVSAKADQKKVNQFAALGSPFKGTDWAYACGCPSCFDMRPPGPGGCAKATWWSPCDEIINPDSSASCGSTTKTACLSHKGLLDDLAVYQQVRNYVAP
jgi:triacylglycerol lipase